MVLPGCVLNTPGELMLFVVVFPDDFLVVCHACSPVPLSPLGLKTPANHMVSSESKCIFDVNEANA